MNIEYIQVVTTTAATVITVIVAVLGQRLNAWNKKKTQLDVIKEYYKEGDAPKLVRARREVLQIIEDGKVILRTEEGSKEASELCNFFNKWGMMVKYGNLPFYIFKGSSGVGVSKIYKALLQYIELRRQDDDNELYAKDFEYLYQRVTDYMEKRKRKKWYYFWLKS
jgi:hypothetical protein